MQIGQDHDTPANHCLDCGALLDGAFSVGGDHAPESGSITICAECGHMQAFDHNLHLRPLTDEEIIGIAGDPRLLAAQQALSKVKKKDT